MSYPKDPTGWYVFEEEDGRFKSTLQLASAMGAGSDSPVLTLFPELRERPDGTFET